MPTTAGRKLVLLGLVLVGVTAWFAWQGASASWQYYLTVDEFVAQGDALRNVRVRLGGKVAEGTLAIGPDRRRAGFDLAGAGQRLPVQYTGILPDNLAEGRDVVVEGRWQGDGPLQADRLLTRCASKYEPGGDSEAAAAGTREGQ